MISSAKNPVKIAREARSYSFSHLCRPNERSCLPALKYGREKSCRQVDPQVRADRGLTVPLGITPSHNHLLGKREYLLSGLP